MCELLGYSGSEAGRLALPLGDTDSEHAFCRVLERIAAGFSAPDSSGTRAWLGALPQGELRVYRAGRRMARLAGRSS